MRIGIVPTLDAHGGGIYQYSLTMLQKLQDLTVQGMGDEFVLLTETSHPVMGTLARKPGWSTQSLLRSPLQKAVKVTLDFVDPSARIRHLVYSRSARAAPPSNLDDIHYQAGVDRRLRKAGIELMLYPAPNLLSFETTLPYVMAIHDLQHRLQPEFPEVSADGEWEWREYLFRNGARRATLILADSEVGRDDILGIYEAYGLTPDRVKILPFLSTTYLTAEVSDEQRRQVQAKYRIPEHYLFYPAQWWPHKNHARIVQAIGSLKQEGIHTPIVLCGSHTDPLREQTFQETMASARQLDVADQVLAIGHVRDEEMAALYSGATALVMPTFFGPTNIPVLEAWALGCPVLTSDIRGIREQVGDAAILADPRSVKDLAEGIGQLWTNEGLRRELAERGRRRLASYTPDDYQHRLSDVLEEAKARVRLAKKG